MATMADVANIAQPEPVDLPGVPKGMDKEAEQMWNELTRMAKEDPKKYDKFVKGQMKDAERAHEAEQKSQPQPAICVESWGKERASDTLLDSDLQHRGLLVKDKRRLVVSICGSDKVPPLASQKDGSVPILLRDAVEPPGDADRTILWQAVFHPGVVKKAERDAGFRKDLIGLCWECVQDKTPSLQVESARSRVVDGEAASGLHSLAAKEVPSALPPGFPAPGAARAKKRKGKKQARGGGGGGAEVRLPGAPQRWAAGTTVTITGLKNAAQHNGKRGVVRSFNEDKGRYLVRLADGEQIRVKPDNALLEDLPEERPELLGVGSAADDAPLGGLVMPGSDDKPAEGGGGPLIQEVKRHLRHTIRYTHGSTEMVVEIPMPGRRNAKGVDLSVSATELALDDAGRFEPLRAQLPAVVDTARVGAKFDKSSATLSVTLSVVSQHAGWGSEAATADGTATAAGSPNGRTAYAHSPHTATSDFAALGALLLGGGSS